jgi:hypothetical protein
MFATTLAAAILSITTPTPGGAAPAGAPAPAGSAPAPAAAGSYNPRVCLVDQITGSHLRQRECHQLADWRKMGLDPLPGK